MFIFFSLLQCTFIQQQKKIAFAFILQVTLIEAFLPFFSLWLCGCIRDSQCLQRALGDSQQACSLAAFRNSGAAGIPLKCRLPSGGSQSVPQVGRRTLRACKAGVTWMEGGRTKQDPVSETEENEVHWEGSCLLQTQTFVLGTGQFQGTALCCRGAEAPPPQGG